MNQILSNREYYMITYGSTLIAKQFHSAEAAISHAIKLRQEKFWNVHPMNIHKMVVTKLSIPISLGGLELLGHLLG